MKQIFKIIISIFLLNNLIISNIFAVAVSDNDGSAFITKAEFDSLKNNFQSQIDSYNTGIDTKIEKIVWTIINWYMKHLVVAILFL